MREKKQSELKKQKKIRLNWSLFKGQVMSLSIQA